VRIAVARESVPGEARVGLVPELVGKLRAAGYDVAVQPGAGRLALVSEEAYAAAGATVTPDAMTAADVVVSVQPLPEAAVSALPAGVATISFFPAASRLADLDLRRDRSLTTFGMEYVPRISRAQPMDALSSQSLVAGYRAAIVAAGRLRQFFPLSMTAAGTVPPAQVVVLGAGVAGLQAIATCRRLGAVVKGYDVRAAAAEEIRSLGAQAIELDLPTLDGAGGYAREMTEERAARQRELLAPHIAAADALITTAAVPGRRAPLLVTADMVAAMKPGSVVVDLAAESGGNVEGSKPGGVIQAGGVQLWGGSNVASQMPGPASRLYAHNVVNVVLLMTRDGQFAPNFDDEIVAGMCLTHAGELRGAAAQPAPPSPSPSGKTSTDGEFSALAPASRVENSTGGEFSPSAAADPSTGSGRRT
jgi:H+-translocating NAD(P) transhydrogenase subunit alpha